METKSEENTASSSVLKNDVTGTDENENMKQDDINVLNTNVTSKLEKDDTTDSNPGVRERFVNCFGKTCKNHNAVLKQKGKSILPLFELCRLFLGLNNDMCLAMSSYVKMNAYFKIFHSTGNVNITKTEKEDLVTIHILPEDFYAQHKEKTDEQQEIETESESSGGTMKRNKSEIEK